MLKRWWAKKKRNIPLHFVSDLSGAVFAVGVAKLVQVLDGLEAGVLGQRLVGSVLGQGFLHSLGNSSTEHHNVKQRVGSQSGVCVRCLVWNTKTHNDQMLLKILTMAHLSHTALIFIYIETIYCPSILYIRHTLLLSQTQTTTTTTWEQC